jgi:hypothetical protein
MLWRYPNRFDAKVAELREIHFEMPKEQWAEFTARCREDPDPTRLPRILDYLGLPPSEGGLS